jgi:colanic acid/amylovoran biosynthesis glycosyltransferase
MKLCYITDEYPPVTPHFGGIGVAFQAEAEWFAGNGHEVSVVGFSVDGQTQERTINGVRMVMLRRNRIPKLNVITDSLRVARQAAVHLGPGPGLAICADYGGPLLARPAGHPLVVQMHGCGTLNTVACGRRPKWRYRLLERRTLRSATAVRSVSRFTAEGTMKALGVRVRRLEIIPNAFDPTLFKPRKVDTISHEVLFVGKLSIAVKGVLVLCRAMVPVFESVEQATLTLVGHDGIEFGKSVRAQCLEAIPSRFHSRVSFIERLPREAVAAKMAEAALLAVSSFIEGFPFVILEAMASGLPVVASNRGGIPELVVNGKTGLLADPAQPRTFTEAILTLLRNSEQAARMGNAGRALVERDYSPKVIFGRLHDFYTDVLRAGQYDPETKLALVFEGRDGSPSRQHRPALQERNRNRER